MTTRTKKADPTCSAVIAFLRGNLGKRALAPLTGTDYRALAAAVHILELYNITGDESGLLEAFGVVVMKMQPSTREYAYHAIAQLMEWDSRAKIWAAAGLPFLVPRMRCECEP